MKPGARRSVGGDKREILSSFEKVAKAERKTQLRAARHQDGVQHIGECVAFSFEASARVRRAREPIACVFRNDAQNFYPSEHGSRVRLRRARARKNTLE